MTLGHGVKGQGQVWHSCLENLVDMIQTTVPVFQTSHISCDESTIPILYLKFIVLSLCNSV